MVFYIIIEGVEYRLEGADLNIIPYFHSEKAGVLSIKNF